MPEDNPIIHFTVDNQPAEALRGETILQAARRTGVDIPTLCAYRNLTPHGGCRMCVVEVDGVRGFPTACTTPVEEGMVVRTHTAQLQALRRDILELILSEHPTNCLFCEEAPDCGAYMVTVRKGGAVTGCNSCPQNERCELQALVRRLGLERLEYPFTYRSFLVERYDPFYDRDYNLCILCGRCIRVCQEERGADVLAFKQRGSRTIIGPAFGRTHVEAGCEFCGGCVEACPTGTLAEKTSKWMGKADSETLSTCPLCGLGCQVRLQEKGGELMSSLPAPDSLVPGQLCVKGRFGLFELTNHPERLARPLARQGGILSGCTLDEALDLAAEHLKTCSPGEAGLTLSADCSNEDLYAALKFARQALPGGQVSVDGLEVSGGGLGTWLELVQKSAPLEALGDAGLIICAGVDVRYAYSVVGVELRRARKAGAKIVSIHPGAHSLSRLADEWIRPDGNEMEVFEGLMQPPPGVPVALLIGSYYRAHPAAGELLPTLQRLAQRLQAEVIPLVPQSNLGGVLSLAGAFPAGGNPSGRQPRCSLRVGCLPGGDSQHGEYEILLHFAIPFPGNGVDLAFPCTPFSEMDGSLTSSDGRVRRLAAAVPPFYEAVPAWKVLSLLASRMGVEGLEFSSCEQVQAEIAAQIPGWKPGGRVSLTASLPGHPLFGPDVIPADYAYQGYGLTRWVAGLRSIIPSQEVSVESHS